MSDERTMSDERRDQSLDALFAQTYDRSGLLKRAAMTGAALGLAPLRRSLERARGRPDDQDRLRDAPRPARSPSFGEANKFVINQMRKLFRKGIRSGKNTYPVEILCRDSQSNSNRAASVAQSLILDDDVDLMLVAGTPRHDEPGLRHVRGEQDAVHLTVAPWQPWFFGRKGNPAKGVQVHVPLLLGPRGHHRRLPRHVEPGADEQGRRRALPERPRRQRVGATRSSASRRALKKAGYTLVDPGRYPEPQRRLLEPDLGSSRAANVADRDRRPDPARLRHLLDAGAPAGLPSEGRVGRQGAALPVGGRGARQRRRRHVDRGVVEPGPPRTGRR